MTLKLIDYRDFFFYQNQAKQTPTPTIEKLDAQQFSIRSTFNSFKICLFFLFKTVLQVFDKGNMFKF